MKNGKLFGFPSLLLFAALFLTGCSGREQLAPDQRTQAQSSTNSLVQRLVQDGFQAVDVSEADEDQPFPHKVTVRFKKCAPQVSLQRCADGVSAPAVLFNAEVDSQDKVTVTRLKEFELLYRPGTGATWRCQPVGAYDIGELTLQDGINAVRWAHSVSPHEGNVLLPLTSRSSEQSKLEWRCDRN